uniref:helix-turn-helix domain-containing protein n=1 Tax=Paractinoplanes polyasparticus TaxID=2856853 RepID=UPI001C84FA83|nr:helix-turn-helix domain-containing protein [Actinoplanes polyasparticus]
MAASAPGEVLGRQVRRWREERKLSAQALANRLHEMGSKLDRRSIFKIETENRSVSVDEWLQLAHALAVPPPLLLVDLDSGDDVAIAPNIALHPWIVWRWIGGEHASPVPSERGGALVSRVEEFGRARLAVQLYQQEEASSNAVSRAAADIRAAEYTGDEERLRVAKSDRVDNLRILAQALDAMLENGMTPPGKPPAVIEAIRSLDLSKYPDRLVVWTGPADEETEAPSDVMRPVTPEDAAEFNAAAARRRKRTGGNPS